MHLQGNEHLECRFSCHNINSCQLFAETSAVIYDKPLLHRPFWRLARIGENRMVQLVLHFIHISNVLFKSLPARPGIWSLRSISYLLSSYAILIHPKLHNAHQGSLNRRISKAKEGLKLSDVCRTCQ